MTTLRVRATAHADGELRLRGLPVRKGDMADVIDGDDSDAVMAVLQEDPAWTWLKDPAKDLYSEQDVK